MTPAQLADLHAAAFAPDRAWGAQEFRSLRDSPHCHLSVVPHGFALWRAVADEAELLTLAVHPDRHRQGLASRLMHMWLEAAARTAQTAFLEVASDNAAAFALYERFGFETVARRTGYYPRNTGAVDALVMRTPLPHTIGATAS